MSLPAVVGFLDQDYRYKSVVAWISHDAGLALVRTVGNRTRTPAFEAMSLKSLHSLNRFQITYLQKLEIMVQNNTILS